MTKNKYNYTITDIEALRAAYPKAVQIEMKPVRAIITKLFDCGIEVPGIVNDPQADPAAPASGEATPAEAHAKKLFEKPKTKGAAA